MDPVKGACLVERNTIPCIGAFSSPATIGDRRQNQNLPKQPEVFLVDKATELALRIASKIPHSVAPTVSYFISLPGMYWDEAVSSKRIVVLARRKGPRNEQSGQSTSVQTEQFRDDTVDDFLEILDTRDGLSIDSDSDEDSISDASGLSFSQGDAKSNLSSLALSSSDDDGDQEELDDLEDPDTVPSDIYSDDSDSEIMADLNISSIGSCRICGKATVYHLSCDICQDGKFSMCRGCWETGAWCNDSAHKLEEFQNWRSPARRTMSSHESKPELELLIFDNNSNSKTLIFSFFSKSRAAMPSSPPTLHPSLPLVAWHLWRGRFLFANYTEGSSFIYKTHFLGPRERCFASSIQFSVCGRFLYATTLSALVLGNNVDYSEVIVHFSSHRLLSDNLAHSPAITASYSRFVISLRNSIRKPIFSFTWTPKHVFISGNYRYMVLYRIDLNDHQPEIPTPRESPTRPSIAIKSSTSVPIPVAVFVPTNHLALPAVVRHRTISFFPNKDGLVTVLVGFRQAPKTALAFAVLLQPDSLGPWVSLYSKANITSASLQFSHESEPHDPREEEFKCDGTSIRLRLTEDKKGEKIYQSADGVLQIKQGESRSFSFSPYGGRGSSTSLISFSMKPAKAGTNRTINSDFEIPLINLQNDDDPKSLDLELPKPDAKNDEDEERMMFQQLYDVVLASYAPRSDHEQGAYWRDLNSIESNSNQTSSLCARCHSLHLTPEDFLYDNCEEDGEFFMNLVDRSVGESYSFRCDSCRSKFEAPCDSYRCCICNNGDYDLCSSCYRAGEHCRSRSHTLRKTSFEHRYTDAKIYGISSDLDTTVPRWEGRLGTLQEVKGRTSCPLCRLSLESLRQSWLSEPDIPESSDPEDEEKPRVTLHWRAFGWNQKRYHDQGRYLVAEYGGQEGRPIVLMSECQPFAPFTAYRLGAGQVDIPALQLWLKHCEENHGWDCHPKPSQISKRGLTQFRAIDVAEKCVVQIPFPSRFVALSYVWGHAAQFCALQSTIGDLEKKGYLDEIQAKLPRTILDAIDFTNQMGERYLWVDALCIVQDDSESRESLIGKMDLIFGSSVFTIIGAAGNGAEAGLPGVKPGSRRPQQVIEEVSPDVKLMLLQPLETKLEHSVYETRGWTFQEKILSRRRFIFLPDGVYFQCERRMCREDFCKKRPDVVSSILQGTDRGISAASYFGTRPGRAYTPGGIFERLVESYLQRSLTIDSDILRGFQGLLGVLEQRFGFHFIAGMPIENLDSCLLWVSRRNAKRRAGFPSFSWAGWTGGAIWPAQEGVTHPFIPYALAENKSWYTNATYIEWRQCNPGHDPELVRSGDQAAYSWLLSKEKPSASKHRPSTDSMGRPLDSETDYGKTKGKRSNKENNKEVPVEPNPRDSFSNVPEAVVREKHASPNQLSLNFRAIVLDVLLEESKASSSSRQSFGTFRYLELKCHHNSTHGFVAVPDQFECELPGPGTLILLSNALPRYSISSNMINTKPQTSSRPAYHVMLVQKSGDGPVERVGIGILEKSALSCELSEGPRWQNIVLT
ncbi:hypothetical protein F4678DRAFT_239639 [Xylaria arbuscula]|nr:hypothetical protein F4678DRAFT_239639 [Xylaria arbuscula]